MSKTKIIYENISHKIVKIYDLPPCEEIEIPEGGWKERTCYEVIVSLRPSNPCFIAIFYTGFLNGKNKGPGGYAKIWIPGSSKSIEFESVYFMRPIRVIMETD